MASEAQRIMNLSLTKIVSSRGRRGGVSLHRNLLVASVLFKARDVYAAEVAGLVVIRNGFVYDRSAPPAADHDHEAPEVPDQCSETDDDNIIPDQRIQDTVNAVVVDPVPVYRGSTPGDEAVERELLDADREKENIQPMDSKPVKRSLRSSKVQCRKRKYTEVEQAVLSITEKSNNDIATKKAHIEEDRNSSLNCSEFSSTLPQWSANQTSVAEQNLDSFHSANNQSSDSFHNPYSVHSYNDYDGDVDDDESMYHDNNINSFQPSCHVVDSCNSAASDSISRSLSHSVLVVSV